MVGIVGGVGDHSVHHRSPVYQRTSGKQKLAEVVRPFIHGQRSLGIQCEGLFIGLERGLVFVMVIESSSYGSSEASVYYRKLPILLVVYLLAADEYGRTSGEGADLELLLVLEPGEVLAEREHRLGGIGRCLIIPSEAV